MKNEVVVVKCERNRICFVVPKESIEIHSFGPDGGFKGIKRFTIGDFAEHDSYNMRYTAEIVQITAKNVVFQVGHKWADPTKIKTKRLPIESFAWRNWNYDAQEVLEYNHTAMMNT